MSGIFYIINRKRSIITKIGTIIPQQGTDRIDIRFSLTEYYGGLHCGDFFEVKVNGKWIPTRIEFGRDWFLVGIKTDNLVGLIVRI